MNVRRAILVLATFLALLVPSAVQGKRSSPQQSLSESSEAILRRFLAADKSSDFAGDGKFYIQGWRWHSMSLIREAGQLQKLAQTFQLDDADADKLKIAAEYVVGFNMKGLHSIEKDLFFPWVRERTCRAVKDEAVCRAICAVMDQLESDRQKLESVGASLVSVDPLGCLYS